MLVVGSLARAWVVATAVEDTKAMEGVVVASRVVFEGAGGDLPVVISTVWAVDTWLVGPCAWGPTVGRGLSVELVGACSEELRVLEGLPALAAAVWLFVANVALAAVLGDTLVLGTCAWGVLRVGSPVVAVAGFCHTDVGMGDGGMDALGAARASEVALSVAASAAARVLTFVLWVVSAVTLVELRLAAKVPLLNLTVEGATVFGFSDVS